MTGGEILFFALCQTNKPTLFGRGFLCKQMGSALLRAGGIETEPLTQPRIRTHDAFNKCVADSQKLQLFIQKDGEDFAAVTVTSLGAVINPFFVAAKSVESTPTFTTLLLKTNSGMTYHEWIEGTDPECRAHSGQKLVTTRTRLNVGNQRINAYHPESVKSLSIIIAALKSPRHHECAVP
jgi:hypothetical protein